MDVIAGLSFGFLGLSFVLLGYFLVDCQRRRASDFPALAYGGRVLAAKSVKRLWTWFLVGSFVLGVVFSHEVWRQWETEADIQVPMGAKSYREEIVFYTTEFARVGEDNVYRSVTLKFPLLFLVGLGVYDRGVRRWKRSRGGAKLECVDGPG